VNYKPQKPAQRLVRHRFAAARTLHFTLPSGGAGLTRYDRHVSYAVNLMAFLGIAAGFVTATITSDTQRGLQVAIGIFAVTGALLTIRLWRNPTAQ
jgi:hypothetical protein